MSKTSEKITENTSQVHELVLLPLSMIWSKFAPVVFGHWT